MRNDHVAVVEDEADGVVNCAAYTDWAEIAGLCRLLERPTASPVVKLNRAAAVAMADNIGGALVLLEELSSDDRLERYYLLEATRADLLRRQGNQAEADLPAMRALPLAPFEVERRYLMRPLQESGRLLVRQCRHPRLRPEHHGWLLARGACGRSMTSSWVPRACGWPATGCVRPVGAAVARGTGRQPGRGRRPGDGPRRSSSLRCVRWQSQLASA